MPKMCQVINALTLDGKINNVRAKIKTSHYISSHSLTRLPVNNVCLHQNATTTIMPFSFEANVYYNPLCTYNI